MLFKSQTKGVTNKISLNLTIIYNIIGLSCYCRKMINYAQKRPNIAITRSLLNYAYRVTLRSLEMLKIGIIILFCIQKLHFSFCLNNYILPLKQMLIMAYFQNPLWFRVNSKYFHFIFIAPFHLR